MLAWTIYISFLGVLALMLLPTGAARAARGLALLTALAGLGIGVAGYAQFETGRIATLARVPWIPSLGIQYHLAADGISLTLVLLTGVAAVAGILFSWNIEHRAKEFFAFYLALIGGVYGVFLSFDLFLLFVFYELAIIPKYFLIAIWGSTRREYGAMKLALYSFVGSAMVLVGLIAAYVVAGARTLDIMDLAGFPFPLAFQMWAFPVVFVGFAILAGLWPFHTWAPTGHVAAPTAASMLLAGVVMKLGAYGCLRVAMTLFPRGLEPWGFQVLGFASWGGVFAVLAVTGIVYGAMVALVQTDFKFVIGYSSVSHMGFVLLGLMTLNAGGSERRGAANVLARCRRRAAVRGGRPDGLRSHPHPGSGGAAGHEPEQGHPLRRGDVRAGGCRIDGASRVQRIRRRSAGVGRGVGGVPDAGRPGRSRHRGGGGLHVARNAEGVLR
jgi:NADH-quinone oxidoreductase subunit M